MLGDDLLPSDFPQSRLNDLFDSLGVPLTEVSQRK